ncbi:MAG TPA: glycosyltransferase family 2 protein [Solirubrobacter sp.]|nr:glycosyltransferase family 2 protein [Solirubrobacter sp.]
MTVVIPCFNYGRFLPDAVESVLTQEGVDVDVVIVDDCSTDNSLAIARALAARHPAVTVLAHTVNQGPVATFNDGLERVGGEFLVRLDADDLLTPGSLARSTALAYAYPSVGLVYGHPRHFEGKPPAHRSRVRSWTVWPGRQWLGDRCRDGYNVITAPEVLMRTSVVERVGGQMPLAHTHDMEMWLRMAAFSDIGRVGGADQAWHREHAASLSSRKVDRIKDLAERRAAFDVLFSGPVGVIPEAPTLRCLAQRAIARDALREACHLLDRGKATEDVLERLVTIAGEVEPAGGRLRGWRQLERRRALDIDRVSSRPWYVAAALGRRLRNELRYLHWTRTGVYGPSRPLSAGPR